MGQAAHHDDFVVVVAALAEAQREVAHRLGEALDLHVLVIREVVVLRAGTGTEREGKGREGRDRAG